MASLGDVAEEAEHTAAQRYKCAIDLLLQEMLEALFRRRPELQGFAARPDRPRPWHLTWHPRHDEQAVLDEIAQTLLALVEGGPKRRRCCAAFVRTRISSSSGCRRLTSI